MSPSFGFFGRASWPVEHDDTTEGARGIGVEPESGRSCPAAGIAIGCNAMTGKRKWIAGGWTMAVLTAIASYAQSGTHGQKGDAGTTRYYVVFLRPVAGASPLSDGERPMGSVPMGSAIAFSRHTWRIFARWGATAHWWRRGRSAMSGGRLAGFLSSSRITGRTGARSATSRSGIPGDYLIRGRQGRIILNARSLVLTAS